MKTKEDLGTTAVERMLILEINSGSNLTRVTAMEMSKTMLSEFIVLTKITSRVYLVFS